MLDYDKDYEDSREVAARLRDTVSEDDNLALLHDGICSSIYEQMLQGVKWYISAFLQQEFIRSISISDFNGETLKRPGNEEPETDTSLFVEKMWTENCLRILTTVKLSSNRVEFFVDPLRGRDVIVAFTETPDAKVDDFLKALRPIFPKFERGQPATFQINARDLVSKKIESMDAENSAYDYVTPEAKKLITSGMVNINFTFGAVPADTLNLSSTRDQLNWIELTLKVQAKITLPIELMMRVMSVEDPKDVSRAITYQFARDTFKEWAGKNSGGWPIFVRHPKTVISDLGRWHSKAGFKPRVNKDGWAITGDGKPRKIPTNETGGRLLELLRATDKCLENYDSATTPEEQNKALASLNTVVSDTVGGKAILFDWVNDNALVASDDGEISMVAITGWRPLDDDMINRFLNLPLTDARFSGTGGGVRSPLGLLNQRLSNYYAAKRIEEAGPDGDPIVGPSPFDKAYGFIVSSPIRLCLKHLCGLDLDSLQDEENGEQAIHACSVYKELVTKAFGDADEVMKDMVESTRYGMAGFIFEMVATLSNQRYEAIKEFTENEADKRKMVDLTDSSGAVRLPGVDIRDDKFEFVQPHQLQADGRLAGLPARALVGVDAGGGKTIIGIVAALLGLGKGEVSRPLILCPPRLVQDWTKEVNMVCNGRVNAMPFRPDYLEYVFKQAGITTFDGAIKWLQALPRNTIFIMALNDAISSRPQFDEEDKGSPPPPSYWSYYMDASPMQTLAAAMNFDLVILDESQNVKNSETARYWGVSSIVSRAKHVFLMSGTMVMNTVVDLHGQAGLLDPSVTGTLDQFKERYGIEGGASGLITDPRKVRTLRADIEGSMAWIVHKRSDWSYLLPPLHTHMHRARMTPKQFDFYNMIMQEARIALMQSMGKKASERTVNLAMMEMEEEELEGKLDKSLARVEQFLIDPENDAPTGAIQKLFEEKKIIDEQGNLIQPIPAYRTWKGSPSGADLISPKVAVVDAIIDQHLASGQPGKILVFGYHKRTSAHVMKYSRHRSKMVHYTAGDDEALVRLRDDASIIGAVCDETSVAVGKNLQFCSRIIRLQSLWTPGGYEQALARIFRPDPRGKYQYDHIDHDWVFLEGSNGGATLDIAKAARFFSKAFNNAEVENVDLAGDDGHDWARLSNKYPPDALPLLKMNLDFVYNFRSEDAEPYFNAWNDLEKFTNVRNTRSMLKVARNIENANPGLKLIEGDRVINKIEMMRHVVVPVKKADSPNLPSQPKPVYVPWVENADPADPYNLGLRLVNDEQIAPGTVVWTEFGPGLLQKLDADGDKLYVLCAHKVVRLKRNEVAMTTNKDGYKRLQAMLKEGMRYVTLPTGTKIEGQPFSGAVRSIQIVDNDKRAEAKKPVDVGGGDDAEDLHKKVKPKQPLTPKKPEKEETTEHEPFELVPLVINGMPAFTVHGEDDVIKSLGDGQWHRIPQFASVEFTNVSGAQQFFRALNKAFHIDSDVWNRLELGLEDLATNKGNLKVVGRPTSLAERNFFRETGIRLKKDGDKGAAPAKLKSKNGVARVRPFWFTWNQKIRLGFSTVEHDPSVIQWVLKKRPGVKNVTRVPPSKNENMWMRFFSNAQEALSVAKAYQQKLLAQGRTVRNKPTEESPYPGFNVELKKMSELLMQMKSVKPRRNPTWLLGYDPNGDEDDE